MFQMILLVTAVSVDAFAAGFTYGVSKVKVPGTSVLIVTGVSSLVLGFSLAAGSLLCQLVPGNMTRYVSFVILFVLGIVKLLDRSPHEEAEQADRNQDAFVSAEEAAVLGAALSLDSLAAGVGAGVQAPQIPAIFLLSFLVGALAIELGGLLGRLISARCQSNLCWISGILLIVLAFMKLI